MKRIMTLLLCTFHMVGAFPGLTTIMQKLGFWKAPSLELEHFDISMQLDDKNTGPVPLPSYADHDTQEENQPSSTSQRTRLKSEALDGVKSKKAELLAAYTDNKLTKEQLGDEMSILYIQCLVTFSPNELKQLFPEFVPVVADNAALISDEPASWSDDSQDN